MAGRDAEKPVCTPLAALLLTATLTVSMAACGSADPVVVATIGAYHPFDFINDEGEIDGLERGAHLPLVNCFAPA